MYRSVRLASGSYRWVRVPAPKAVKRAQVAKVAKQGVQKAEVATKVTTKAKVATKAQPKTTVVQQDRILQSGSKLTLKYDTTPAALWSAFREAAVLQFVKQYKLVNGHFHPNKIVLQGHNVVNDASTNIAWKDIDCKVVNSNVKASPCRTGTAKKVFFRKARNLSEYIKKVQAGKISRTEHNGLFAAVHAVAGESFANHNWDVNLLHFKSK